MSSGFTNVLLNSSLVGCSSGDHAVAVVYVAFEQFLGGYSPDGGLLYGHLQRFFAVGAQAETHRQILCSVCLVSQSAAVQLHLQQSGNGHSALGCTTGLLHQPSVLGH